jgi:poly(A) polymerase
LRFRYSTAENGKPVKKAAVYTQDEHGINFSDVDSQAVYITERLQANGFETYIVGGAVRDLILKKKPKDFDIVTAANPTRIKKIFRNARIIGRRFRLVHVYFGPKIFEISTFRSMKDGPSSNTFGTIEEDVRRRDFSFNALFYDPSTRVVVDYVNGIRDIRKRKIRAIIAPEQIFADDPVRMIRAVKYAAAMDFKLPISLRWRIKKHSGLLAGVSSSRLTEEIFKIIHSPYAPLIIKSLDAMNIYRYIQPHAAEFFKTMPGFKARYFKTMETLGSGNFKNLPGQALSALIRDYLEDLVDWDGSREGKLSSAELYKGAFSMARKFVLPMNPPKTELDMALKSIFAEHGLQIKKTRFHTGKYIANSRRRSSRAVPTTD